MEESESVIGVPVRPIINISFSLWYRRSLIIEEYFDFTRVEINVPGYLTMYTQVE